MSETDKLVEPYVPVPVYYEGADRLEYVVEDVPCYYARYDSTLVMVYRQTDDRLIGVEIHAPMRAFTDLKDRLQAAEAKALRLEEGLRALVEFGEREWALELEADCPAYDRARSLLQSSLSDYTGAGE